MSDCLLQLEMHFGIRFEGTLCFRCSFYHEEKYMVLHYFDSPRSIGGSNCNKLFCKKLISSEYYETASICEDNLFLIQYSMKIQKACYINLPLYNINERPDSAIRANPESLYKELPIREKIVSLMKFDSKLYEKARADYLDTMLGLYLMFRGKYEGRPRKQEIASRDIYTRTWVSLLEILKFPQI